MNQHDVDVLIVGAGPVGLYGAYYAGFRGLTVAVVDALPTQGGQVSALYPEKKIFDIAGLPAVKGQDLVSGLLEQAAPFGPTYLLGQQAQTLVQDAERWTITTSAGTTVRASAVVITGGVGAVSPRPLPCAEEFLGRGLKYFVPRLDVLDGQDVVIVGGGDSAVDWALASVERARSTTLVHRRTKFRAHAHSVTQLQDSECRLVLDAEVTVASPGEDGQLACVEAAVKGELAPLALPCTLLVAALGFTMQIGPIAEWGLDLQDRSILVDTAARTNLPGVFAAGDISTYEGKVKLIAVGFGEVATAVNNAAAHLQPDVGLAPGHSSDAPPPQAMAVSA